MRDVSLAGPASRHKAPAKPGRLSRRGGDARFGQGTATESIGTRGYRLLKGEACRLSQNHPSIRVRDCGKEILGDRGIPGGEVHLLRCSGG